MKAVECLDLIKDVWLDAIPKKLAERERVRAGFQELLPPFFNLLRRAIETEEPVWLDSLLTEWAVAPTETELNDSSNSFVQIIGQIFTQTSEIATLNLPSPHSLSLIVAIIPIFSHAMEYVSNQETQMRIQHIRNDLDKAQLVLEKLEKTKSDFISVAAHELKTPLTLIEGYTSMLKEALPPDVNQEVQIELCLKGMDAGTKRLQEIVNDMIDVSMIDNNMLSLAFQPVWISHLISAIEREIEETLKQRNLTFKINQFPGFSEMFFGDGERLYQALRNVITNAIKYTPDGGCISLDGRLLPGFVEIIISDTGIGIDPDDHIRIFEKFGRIGDVSLHSSGKTKFKGGGPGLGLPITKGIIDAHGGAIWVESEGFDEVKCPGSTFHIMLPLRKTPPDDRTARLFRGMSETKNENYTDGKKRT